jgi:hypothetical protein
MTRCSTFIYERWTTSTIYTQPIIILSLVSTRRTRTSILKEGGQIVTRSCTCYASMKSVRYTPSATATLIFGLDRTNPRLSPTMFQTSLFGREPPYTYTHDSRPVAMNGTVTRL